ncbi:MAG: energy transducer TonB [Sphingomonas sp.]
MTIASHSLRRLVIGLPLAATLAAPSLAAAPDGAGIAPVTQVYPALRQGGAAYMVTTGTDGRIAECDAVDNGARTPAVDQACATLAAKGIPAGIEPARPEGKPERLLSLDDIPESMMFTNTHVGAQLIFEVDDRGKVSACRAYKSTGWAEFDALACQLFRKRARFTPARLNGKPTFAVGSTFAKFDSY